MTDAEKLRQYASEVDELRRMVKLYPRPLNRVNKEAMEKQEKKVDALTALYLPAPISAELPSTSPAT